MTDLASSGYDKFTILDVEAPADITRARALTRWWRGRVAAVGGGDPMGGRFTPGFVIDALYTPGFDRTICVRNARAAFDHPLAEHIPTVELLIEHLGADDETWVKEAGVVVYPTTTTQGPPTG